MPQRNQGTKVHKALNICNIYEVKLYDFVVENNFSE